MPLRIVVPESPAAAATRDATTLHYRQLQYPLSEDELLTLRQMRLASGTYYDRIPTWLEEMRTGARLMWFIHLGPPTTTSTSPRHAHHQPKQESSPVSPGNLSFILNPQPHSHSQLQSQVTQREQAWTQPTPEKTWALTPAIAMVCLLTSNPSDPSLASPHTRRFELTSLWIYPAYRSNGVGASIIKQMEYEAAQRGAEYVTFNTSAGYGAPPTPSSVQNSPTHPSNYLVPSATATTTANAQAATGHSSSNNNSNNAALATLRTFERIGYNEYKPREHRYSINDVVNAGLPIESTLAAFFEKYVGRPRPYTSTSNSSGGSGSSGPSLKGQVSV